MKKLLQKCIMIALASFVFINCYAEEPMCYVYNHSVDVPTQRVYDVFGYKRKMYMEFSSDYSKVYIVDQKTHTRSNPYFYKGVQGGWMAYQRKEFRGDGIPYYPTFFFSQDFRTMSEDLGDHLSFNTRNVYYWQIK